MKWYKAIITGNNGNIIKLSGTQKEIVDVAKDWWEKWYPDQPFPKAYYNETIEKCGHFGDDFLNTEDINVKQTYTDTTGERFLLSVEGKTVLVQSLDNPVQFSFHDWDEAAENPLEAIQLHIEHMQESDPYGS